MPVLTSFFYLRQVIVAVYFYFYTNLKKDENKS